MPLAPGTRIGPYAVGAPIGAGGMGEVYRATDVNLKRDVAIKILPAELAGDPERLARFQREAEVLGRLNHPNIAQIHGLERRGGTTALVMEFVEGPTLADHIAQGAIPVDDALAIAKQIAEALGAAHEQGIVHRDLKPANIKVRPDGTVKVLDFGLAKAMEPAGAVPPGVTQSPTITTPAMTQAGVLLGTAAYMSPEQARGKPVDKRADIWAFGVVLYEMVTGRRLFRGEDMTETLASVVKDPLDVNSAPPKMRRLLSRCLEKDPKKRLRDIGDAWDLVEEERLQAGRARHTSSLWPALAATLAIALIAVALIDRRETVAEVRTTKFQVTPPPNTQFFGTATEAVSPDGRSLVFAAVHAGEPPGLWLQPLNSLVARPLPGTENGSWPFWSPDSRFIAFFADGKLKRLDTNSGLVLDLCDTASSDLMTSGAWGVDDVILFGSGQGLRRVPSSGGDPEPVTVLDATREETGHGFPQFLPDGRFLYFIQSKNPDTRGVYVASLDAPEERTRIVATDRKARYTPAVADRPAYLLWLQDQTLIAQPFDARRLRFQGNPIQVAEHLITGQATARAAFWTSQAGVLLYRDSGDDSARMTWYSRAGKRLDEVGPEASYQHVRLSPDGSRVAAIVRDESGHDDVWLFDIGDGGRQLTFDQARDEYPVWSPDGSELAFSSNRTGVFQVYRKDVAGAGSAEPVTAGVFPHGPEDWSRDGRNVLLYRQTSPNTGIDIWAVPLNGGRDPFPVVETSGSDWRPAFSPDGQWFAYGSNETGQWEVWLQRFPPSAGKWKVSSHGGDVPRWNSDGTELYYLSPAGSIMAARIRMTSAGPEPEAPREVIATGRPWAATVSPYDVAGDGRFLVLERTENSGGSLTVMDNWQAELGQ
jgi:Tol biopolymer transport system component